MKTRKYFRGQESGNIPILYMQVSWGSLGYIQRGSKRFVVDAL